MSAARLASGVGVAIAAAVIIAVAARGAGGAPGPSVEVATTGNDSELVKTVAITRRAGRRPRVAMSMRPGHLPELARGDLLRVSAELQVTNNCNYRSPRCVGSVYHYDPRVRARLVLAPDAATIGGADALPLAAPETETCTQQRPDFEHHCVLVFSGAELAIGDPARLPCALDRCHLNLVVDAHNPRARRGDLLMIGGQRPDGRIPQDRGRINAVRLRDIRARDYERETTDHRRRRHLRLDFHRRVAYSLRLDRLRDGEQLEVGATLRTDISRLAYAVRTSARLILADSPTAARQGNFVRHHALDRGEIAENNGSNCTRAERVCTYRKAGVLELRHSAVDARGRPVPLYVNLVTVFGPKARKARPDDRVALRRRGGIEVNRYPPALNR